MADRPILVASDLSPRSDRAVSRALRLGKQLGRGVVLAHAISAETADKVPHEELIHLVRQSLADPECDVEIALSVGAAPHAVSGAAVDLNAGLIVAGVARFNSPGDYLLGTAVDQIIARSNIPVLVVKQQAHADYSRLLVAVDYSDCSANALASAARIFPDAVIDVLHAYHVPYEGWQKDSHLRDEAKLLDHQEMGEFLERPELASLRDRVCQHHAYGDIGMVLANEIKRLSPDLIVAGTHGRNAFSRVALGSVASSMLGWVSQDMMVVPPSE